MKSQPTIINAMLDAPAERVWEIVSRTNRLNRALGVPAMDPSELGGEGTRLFRHVRLKGWLGFLPGWRDYPFDWVKQRWLRAYREFENGLLTHLSIEVTLHPEGKRTAVRVSSEIGARFGWLAPLANWLAKISTRRALRAVEKALDAQTPAVWVPAIREVSAQAKQRLDEYQIFGKGENEIGNCLRTHLLQSEDSDVRRMQPFALADRWGVSRSETLLFFLRATHAGLLEMNWELLCPNCRVPKGSFTTLRELQPKVHCEVCELDFETKLDEFIELRFTVSPRVRETTDAIFCIGSPNNTPHILSQVTLRPGEGRELVVQLPPETVRCRALRSSEMAALVSDAKRGANRVTLEFTGQSWTASSKSFSPGLVVLHLHNGSKATATLALECLAWESCAVTAAQVTALQEFRSLFALEVLPAGAEVGVRSVTLLFSDLKSSTRLYEDVGDATAFSRVQKHFDFILRCVSAQRGAIVKTMGDAVMAVFSDPADALRAALDMQQGVNEFCRDAGIKPALELKIGIHTGPSISFQGEKAIDYFGRTVNIAARTQGQSEGGEILITDAVFESPSVQAALPKMPLAATAFRSRLKGIREEQDLHRLKLRAVRKRPRAKAA